MYFCLLSFVIKFFLIGVWLICNIVLVSVVQQCESHIYIHIPSLLYLPDIPPSTPSRSFHVFLKWMTVDIKVVWYFITLDIFKRVMKQFHIINFCFNIFYEILLIHNVVLICTYSKVIQLCVFFLKIFFSIMVYHRILNTILCYTIGPCLLIMCLKVCIC